MASKDVRRFVELEDNWELVFDKRGTKRKGSAAAERFEKYKSTNKRKHMPSSKSVEASKLTFRTISGRGLSISSLQMEKNTTMSRMTIVLNNPMTQLNPFMVKAKLLTKIKIANRSARKW